MGEFEMPIPGKRHKCVAAKKQSNCFHIIFLTAIIKSDGSFH